MSLKVGCATPVRFWSANIEQKLKSASPLIGQAVAIGDVLGVVDARAVGEAAGTFQAVDREARETLAREDPAAGK